MPDVTHWHRTSSASRQATSETVALPAEVVRPQAKHPNNLAIHCKSLLIACSLLHDNRDETPGPSFCRTARNRLHRGNRNTVERCGLLLPESHCSVQYDTRRYVGSGQAGAQGNFFDDDRCIFRKNRNLGGFMARLRPGRYRFGATCRLGDLIQIV